MESVHNHADSRAVARVLNQVVSQFDNTGSINLANSTTTTTVSNSKVVPTSKVFLQPRTAAAVTAGAFVSSISSGSFVITHASETTVRTFDYVVFGV